MQFHILGLFPDVLDSYFAHSLIGKARESGLVSFSYHQLRDWAKTKYQNVDDAPYGGGAGMVMLPQVVCDAVRALKAKHNIQRVVHLSPRGHLLTPAKARALSQRESILFLSGRFEGIDQRAIDLVVDEEISIGDYVISCGELAAGVVVDAVCRFVPGVIGKEESVQNDSFENGLLEHPHYTRPEIFEGLAVPKVLLTGNHKKIDEWRHEESVKITEKRKSDIYLALIHYPILNKEGKVITTSVTNFDLHDLARTGKTFGVKKVFIVTPLPAQLDMIRYIKSYWREGTGAQYNPDRSEAFEIIEPSPSIDDTCLTIKNLSGNAPHLVATTAKRCEKSVGYSAFQKTLQGEKPVLIAFGTGFGLTNEFLQRADIVLDPICGMGDYNHLPVRSAVAIILDRLVQRRKESAL